MFKLGFGDCVCFAGFCTGYARLYVWYVLVDCLVDVMLMIWSFDVGFWLVSFACCLSAVIWCCYVRCLMLVWFAVNSVVYAL